MSFSIGEIVNSVFYNNREQSIALLERHGFDKLIVGYYNHVLLTPLPEEHIDQTASLMLAEINEIMKEVNSQEKPLLEYILGDICKSLFARWIDKTNVDSKIAIDRILKGMKNVCDLKGYNFEEIKRIFNFEMIHSIDAVHVNERVERKIYWYQWNYGNLRLNELAVDLKSSGVIQRKNEFMDLFRETKTDQQIHSEEANINIILVLFDLLHARKAISPKGLKAKKFTPLKYRLVDRENEILMKKEPKRYMDLMKRNKENYQAIITKVSKWIYDL